jgi:hypothetical protein
MDPTRVLVALQDLLLVTLDPVHPETPPMTRKVPPSQAHARSRNPMREDCGASNQNSQLVRCPGVPVVLKRSTLLSLGGPWMWESTRTPIYSAGWKTRTLLAWRYQVTQLGASDAETLTWRAVPSHATSLCSTSAWEVFRIHQISLRMRSVRFVSHRIDRTNVGMRSLGGPYRIVVGDTHANHRTLVRPRFHVCDRKGVAYPEIPARALPPSMTP